jgi:SAM-dependent methyltransferase
MKPLRSTAPRADHESAALLYPMISLLSQSEKQAELQKIYSLRFAGLEAYRNEVWRVLTSKFFSRWIKPGDSVLDLGCGYCEFINNIMATNKFAMDLNPTAREHLARGAELIEQDCTERWPLTDESLDAIFTSNFFEHLPTKASLLATLVEGRRCLKRGGRLIALGPNFKFLSAAYWDFFDHQLPLTDKSLSEALIMTGYSIESVMPRFLPYSMSQGFRPPIWTIHLFLQLPFVWRFLGHQFLVIARRL